MRYLVTGGTGFLGRMVLARLLARDDCEAVYALVRRGLARPIVAPALAGVWRVAEKVVPVVGRPHRRRAGPRPARAPRPTTLDRAGRPRPASRRHLRRHGRRGRQPRGEHRRHPRGSSNWPGRIGATCLHHVSSVAVAGEYAGTLHRGRPRRRPAVREPVPRDQVRRREDRPRGVDGAVAGVPARRRGRRRAAPARWTRSTGRTTCSRRSRLLGRARPRRSCPACSGSRPPSSARPTSSRSTTSPTRWSHLVHAPGLDGRAFHLVQPAPAAGQRGLQRLRRGPRRPAAARDHARRRWASSPRAPR